AVKRLLLPGIPFVFSFLLSLWTAGSHLYWQDSGLFLAAVKELGVLYPPGFVLYLLLCKAWTLGLFWVDFTYAVHLFSSVCAAVAAGTLAVAARDLLRTRGPLFRTAEDDSPMPEWAGACIGCLAACGYTFWAAAILAKGYALYYLILSLLIWRLIRADEDARPRDFTMVAVLIGLAWQAHPSAVNAGIPLLLFVAFHRRAVGGKGVAWRAGLAAACALGPIPLLPLIRRGAGFELGDPSGWRGFWDYATGARFTGIPGVFGVDGVRFLGAAKYFWEEFLGIGLLLVGLGLRRLWSLNRRLLVGLAAGVVPMILVAWLFKIEGQHDFWLVAAWIPLWLVAALGLAYERKARELAAIVALAGVLWAVIANRKDLDQRDYTLAESFGEYYLKALPQGATLCTASDDLYGSTLYLQRVRGMRRDIFLHSPFVRISIAGSAGPVFFERPQYPADQQTLQADGPLFSSGDRASPWVEPLPAEDLPGRFRRARGQQVERTATEVRVRPEPYEMRLLRVLLLARKNRADAAARTGNLEEAARLYGTILALDPGMNDEPAVLFPFAVIEAGLNRTASAEARFKRALERGLEGEQGARACYFLFALTGHPEWKGRALASPDLAPALRAKLEGR
ncbi:MAG: DUF2723 domain-containing protein, partial [Planctomycetaceae bacterium]|nr:DUF2723 domain-containing protein [Planctomycetaceae bacterium]